MKDVGFVFIGRNEGPRLERGLRSALGYGSPVCYVDSASTDDSPEVARGFGDRVWVDVLPPDGPQSAARGRNRGFEILCEQAPEVRYVQFVDGDCALLPGWVEHARAYLEDHPDVGVVAGRLREEERDRNVYHRLADMEWDVPSGDVESTGGINMVRKEAFELAGRYDPTVAAGEELEMCTRVRAAGYRVVRLEHDMATHDIHMDSFAQWWRRCVRNGDGAALGVYRERGRDAARLKEVASMLAWGGALPAAALGLSVPTLGFSLSLLSGYGVLYRRVLAERLRRGERPEDARLYAAAVTLGKVANTAGVLRFTRRYLRGDLRPGG